MERDVLLGEGDDGDSIGDTAATDEARENALEREHEHKRECAEPPRKYELFTNAYAYMLIWVVSNVALCDHKFCSCNRQQKICCGSS